MVVTRLHYGSNMEPTRTVVIASKKYISARSTACWSTATRQRFPSSIDTCNHIIHTTRTLIYSIRPRQFDILPAFLFTTTVQCIDLADIRQLSEFAVFTVCYRVSTLTTAATKLICTVCGKKASPKVFSHFLSNRLKF